MIPHKGLLKLEVSTLVLLLAVVANPLKAFVTEQTQTGDTQTQKGETQKGTKSEDPAKGGAQPPSSSETIAARREFFEKVRSSQKKEPATGAHHSNDGKPEDGKSWLFGYSSYDQNPVAVKIQSREQSYREDDKPFVVFQEITIRFDPDPSKRIVGWKVISHARQGIPNGNWWKETKGPILLGNEGSIHVKSEAYRGTKWTVIWYYVDAKDYPFD